MRLEAHVLNLVPRSYADGIWRWQLWEVAWIGKGMQPWPHSDVRGGEGEGGPRPHVCLALSWDSLHQVFLPDTAAMLFLGFPIVN